jgi:hypothetical protein
MASNIAIDNLLRGAIDMHAHFAPDFVPVFRMDALDTVKSAQQMGMRAIVLKAHAYMTPPLAALAGKLVPDIKVFGSICLDYEVGGLNYHALGAAARIGAKVVWMPTHSSSNEKNKIPGITSGSDGLSLLNSENKLIPEIDKILSLIKEHEMVLATGHISPAETIALLDAARAKGISKIVITHPSIVEILKHGFKMEDLRRLAKMGAFIEHTYVGYLPNELRHDPKNLVETIRAVGAEQSIISTDTGQSGNPPVGEAMRMFIALLLRSGITEHEIELMAKVNPARLLDLN